MRVTKLIATRNLPNIFKVQSPIPHSNIMNLVEQEYEQV